MSVAVQWMIIRENSCHLVKKTNIKKYFNTDPLNPKGFHSPRYCGIIQKKALNIEPHPSGKGVNLVYKKRRFNKKPAKNMVRIPFTRGARRTMSSLKKFINANRYRRDLKMLAMRRASAILKSQKPVPQKKKNPRKKAE